MASLSSKTKSIRLRKHRKAGGARKASLRKNGSTRKFAVHKAS
jgi:hypothetical protein